MIGEKKIENSRTGNNHCLRCRELIDAARGEGRPKPGDFSVCFYCAKLAVFADDMSLREPTAEEIRIAQKDPNIAGVIKSVKAFIRRRAARFN